MKTRNYLKVTSKFDGVKSIQEFTMKEVRLINTVLKEISDNGKCEVELIECTEEEYNSKFI